MLELTRENWVLELESSDLSPFAKIKLRGMITAFLSLVFPPHVYANQYEEFCAEINELMFDGLLVRVTRDGTMIFLEPVVKSDPRKFPTEDRSHRNRTTVVFGLTLDHGYKVPAIWEYQGAFMFHNRVWIDTITNKRIPDKQVQCFTPAKRRY